MYYTIGEFQTQSGNLLISENISFGGKDNDILIMFKKESLSF